ncbi:MAG TPA: DUF1566 domain-containing protein [Ideonella sp.]|nr:DUF1566 domain-containing protein [Ideonella sp.]
MISRTSLAACLALLGTAAAAQTAPFALNDTGSQRCVGRDGTWAATCAGSGQDGAYGRDVAYPKDADGHAGFQYVKLDDAGKPLPRSAKTWRCVADRVTGLVWENKTDDGGPSDKDRNYTNWGDGRPGDTSVAVQDANTHALCGATGWRLPSILEMQGLIDYGQAEGANVDPAWFPNTRDWWYWAGTTYATDPNAAWAVYYSATAGGDGAANRDFKLSARLVRSAAGEIEAGPRYTFAGDEVTDTYTQLIWKRCAAGQSWTGSTCDGKVAIRQWPEALVYAKREAERTGQAWRLPNTKELSTTADRTQKGPAIDLSVFPNVLAHQWYWTATPLASDPSYAWTMDFEGGYTQSYPGRGYDLGIRLVRNAP